MPLTILIASAEQATRDTFAGQLAADEFGYGSGMSPGVHWVGSRPGVATVVVDVPASDDSWYGLPKYHSPLICTLVAEGS